MDKILYFNFSLLTKFLHLILRLYWAIKHVRTIKTGIAILPYYPQDWPGGNRTTAYQTSFKQAGYKCDVFNVWSSKEIQTFLNTNNKRIHYFLYFKLLLRRFSVLKRLVNYDTVWVQRALIPMFPYKHAYFERLLSKYHPNVIYDYYDADYESNYNLVMETVKNAKVVTVASQYLFDKLSTTNPNIHFLRFSVNETNYLTRQKRDDDIKIGWMGSPANAKQLLFIKEALQQIENDYPMVEFSFVCREFPELGLKRQKIFKWGDEGFDYYQWLSTLDIGIVPFIEQTERTKAKISFKSLEFMFCETPQVVSPYVHSDRLIHNESCLIAQQNEWNNSLSMLINNPKTALSLAQSAKREYLNYHQYDKTFQALKHALRIK